MEEQKGRGNSPTPPDRCAPEFPTSSEALLRHRETDGRSAAPSIVRSFLLSSRKVNLMHVLKDSMCPIVSCYRLHLQGAPSAAGSAVLRVRTCRERPRAAFAGVPHVPSRQRPLRVSFWASFFIT